MPPVLDCIRQTLFYKAEQRLLSATFAEALEYSRVARRWNVPCFQENVFLAIHEWIYIHISHKWVTVLSKLHTN